MKSIVVKLVKKKRTCGCTKKAHAVCLERLLDESFQAGSVYRTKDFASQLRSRSGEAYAKNRDEEAGVLRELAAVYERWADLYIRSWEQEYGKPFSDNECVEIMER